MIPAVVTIKYGSEVISLCTLIRHKGTFSPSIRWLATKLHSHFNLNTISVFCKNMLFLLCRRKHYRQRHLINHLKSVRAFFFITIMEFRWNNTHRQRFGRLQWGRSVHPSAAWRAGRKTGRGTGNWRWWTGSWEPALPESILKEKNKQTEIWKH